MSNLYINDPGNEVPDNTIMIVPHDISYPDEYYKETVFPLKNVSKRDWFDPHYYYCLPLTIANQYGFLIKSLRNFDAIWDGSSHDANITFIDNKNEEKQSIKTGFGNGVITFQNSFAIKTPPGINVMTIQPPNMFIPGCVSMTGVVETDQIRRDFTFNLKITIPNTVIKIREGDPIGAFIPVPRYFVDSFDIKSVGEIFSLEMHKKEIFESQNLSVERSTVDTEKPHQSGRRYFNGIHSDGSTYHDHQKKIV